MGTIPVRILDVGCAAGFLGTFLAGQGHTLIGIEPDREAAAQAAPYYTAVHVTSIEVLAPLPEGPFDVIVIGDVLEHLVDPEQVLRLVVNLLAPGGRILLSVPNVAFVGVRLALLVGRFEPAQRGIMDRTHLHFFTRRQLVRLSGSVGTRVIKLVGVPPPVPLIVPALARWPWRVVWEAINLAARAWPTMFAYQLVVEVAV